MPIIRRSDCVTLPMIFCPVVAVSMLEKTIRSETQSDLLMMGVKTPEIC